MGAVVGGGEAAHGQIQRGQPRPGMGSGLPGPGLPPPGRGVKKVGEHPAQNQTGTGPPGREQWTLLRCRGTY